MPEPLKDAFESAIVAIRRGAHYSLSGRRLTVNGVELAITDEQFDIAYDVMDEVDGDESVLRFSAPPASCRCSPGVTSMECPWHG